jgi:hypothetical protein
LNDKGSSTTPWNHTSNQLGSVSVSYYCPNEDTKDYPPQSIPTTTNTLKFGFFSGRWNFGNEVFSNSPFSYWHVSGDKFEFDWEGDIEEFKNPALYEEEGLQYFSTDFGSYSYPYTGNTSSTDFINKMGAYPDTFSDEKHKPWFAGYKIYFPFTMVPAPSNLFPQGLNGQNNATWFYNVTGGLTGADTNKPDDYMTNYGVYSEDSETENNLYIVNENNNLGASLSWNGDKQITMNTGREYDLKTTCHFLNNETGTYSQFLQWYLQLVYSGYVNIFN